MHRGFCKGCHKGIVLRVLVRAKEQRPITWVCRPKRKHSALLPGNPIVACLCRHACQSL